MKCRPVTYAVIDRGQVFQCFRCKHHPWTRFHTKKERNRAMRDHIRSMKGKS